ncbi:MAG: HAMP domain-containing histidine kinase [Cyclobacteriaceae bacterium]|nr:HAMP domain-containing histidine kinase [Cyclobacteriaceae bacterium]
MLPPGTLRKFVLGKSNFIPSHSEYKRVLLTGQLCVITFFFCIGFFFLDLSNSVYHGLVYQLACALLAALSFVLNRLRFFTPAKITLGVAVNFTIFMFIQVEPQEVGLHVFFIPAALGAMAAFGYEERVKSLIMVFLPVGLFTLGQLTDFSIIEKTSHRSDLDHLNLLINFGGALLASVLIVYYLISVNFRSEKSLLENEKQISEKNSELIKLNTELDQFVYSTSHDLMAPLSSVRGLIHLGRVTEDTKELREIIEMMDGRVDDLQKFIRDISDYSRNTRLDIQKKKVLVSKLIRTILENLRSHPHTEKVKIELDVAADLVIYSDQSRLQIILSNLVGNAIKYMDPAKEKPTLKISARLRESHIRFIVQDNGLGIPPRHIHRIFDMFYQANEKAEGSGLGLYIVKQTVEKLKGTILVASEYQLGSTFTVVIPVYSEPESGIETQTG